MKLGFLTAFVLTLSTASYACQLPSYLKGQSLSTFAQKAQELKYSGFKISSEVRDLVRKVIDIDDSCKNNFLSAKTYLLKNGKIIHLAFTNEDICDGGNSYGVVLNANLQPIASIQDTDFYCPVE